MLLRELDGFDDFERRILELEKGELTAIDISGNPNVCAIFNMINSCLSPTATADRKSCNCHIELADGGILTLAFLAQKAVFWHLSFKDLVLVAFDIESKMRTAYFKTKQFSKNAGDLQHYLGCGAYDPAKNVEFLECS